VTAVNTDAEIERLTGAIAELAAAGRLRLRSDADSAREAA
jgi:hypothetical protein